MSIMDINSIQRTRNRVSKYQGNRMKAIVCHKFAPIESLSWEDMPDPTISSTQVLIKVHAAGVNFPDGLLVQGLYQMTPKFPFIPGSEIAGEVIEVGDNVRHINVGQRVIAICQLGGFAQKAAVDANQVLPIPSDIPMVEAAGLTTAYATAHHALKQRANVRSGETVLVTGAAGGTGLAAVQIAKAMGATVIAACSTDDKCEMARQYGADITINYTRQNLKEDVKALTQNKGVDVVYECVGGDIFDACTRLVGWIGRLLVVGFASGNIPNFPVNLALVKGYSIVGVFWGTFARYHPELFAENMQELMTWYLTGKVKVAVDTCFNLEDAVKALTYVANRQVKGKAVLVV